MKFIQSFDLSRLFTLAAAILIGIGVLPLGGAVANAQRGVGSVDDLIRNIVRQAENTPARKVPVDEIRNTSRQVLGSADDGPKFDIVLDGACKAIDIYGFDHMDAAKRYVQREMTWMAPQVNARLDQLAKLQRYKDTWGFQAASFACDLQ
ncbi:hypothetical protein ABQF33_12220 [Mycolicibacterium sp. XJ2]